MNPSFVLKAENLSFSYESHPVLKEAGLEIPEYGLTFIGGASGAGKTTLLMILSLLFYEIRKPYQIQGKIWFQPPGQPPLNLLELKENLHEIRRRVVYLAQTPCMLPMSILDNAAFALKLQGIPKKNRIETALQALEKVHLLAEVKDRLSHPAHQLSGGQKQKLALARALSLNPQALLLDEPTSSLDEENKFKIEDLIKEISKDRAVVLVSHDRGQEQRLAQKTYRLAHQSLILEKEIAL